MSDTHDLRLAGLGVVAAGLAGGLAGSYYLQSKSRESATASATPSSASLSASTTAPPFQPAPPTWAPNGKPRTLRIFHFGAPKHQGRLFVLPDSAGPRDVPVSEALALLAAQDFDTQRWQPQVLNKPSPSADGWEPLDTLQPPQQPLHQPQQQPHQSGDGGDRPLTFPRSGILDIMMVLRPRNSLVNSEGQGGGGGGRSDAYFSIGIFGCKTEANHGTLWRSAYQNGAAYVLEYQSSARG